MAIYHCSIKIVSRGKGKSAVAAAAYRSGETLTNNYDGVTHDFTRKGGIVHTEILLPPHAPPDFADRSALSQRHILKFQHRRLFWHGCTYWLFVLQVERP